MYSSCMSPPVAQQIISTIKIISGSDGTKEGEVQLFLFVFWGFFQTCNNIFLNVNVSFQA